MTLRLAILCPGQGGQHPEMFALARGDAALAARIDAWGLPGVDDLFSNTHAQPLIVGATCAMWERLRGALPAPTVVAGYSVGEVSALAVAGIFDAGQAVALAGRRAGLMTACVEPLKPQTLAAVSGVPLRELRALLEGREGTRNQGTSPQSGAYLAIENGDDQAIVGGMRSAIQALEEPVTARGGRMQALPISVASHTPMMEAAIEPLRKYLETIERREPASRLIAGISAAVMHSAAGAMEALALQTGRTIHWDACMDAVAESGVTAALELGPGTSLSRMLQSRHPEIACRSVADFRSTEGILAWITRRDT